MLCENRGGLIHPYAIFVLLPENHAECFRRGAFLLGPDDRTFGKGRTQRVVPLRDGSVLLVSNVEYLTPKGQAVHLRGLEPTQTCPAARAACISEAIDLLGLP